MVVSGGCRISAPATGQLSGSAGKNRRLVSYGNGEAMGTKLEQTWLRKPIVQISATYNNTNKKPICMSLTADVTLAKVRYIIIVYLTIMCMYFY